MDRNSLKDAFEDLRLYLKDAHRHKRQTTITEKKIQALTIAGKVMSIHNLIKTGAYNQESEEYKKIANLISLSRHTAIHYGFFDDFSNINQTAIDITNNIPEDLNLHFAQYISNLEFLTDCNNYQVFSGPLSQIEEALTNSDLYVFKNNKTGELAYINKLDLLVIENKITHIPSYLLKDNNNPVFFFKKTPDDESVKVSFQYLLDNHFFDEFKLFNRGKKLDSSIKKLLEAIADNPYKNLVVSYQIDNKQINQTIQNILYDILYNRVISEKVLTKQFTIQDFGKPTILKQPNIENLPIRDMTKRATLIDLFYIELFLKKYNTYREFQALLSAEEKTLPQEARQTMLLSLFEIGCSNLSTNLINADKSKRFTGLYHNLKRIRNEVAHSAITDSDEKKELIDTFEMLIDSFYEVAAKVQYEHSKEQRNSRLPKFSSTHKLDANNDIIYNKTAQFAKFEHLGIYKLIDGKKYLKLKSAYKNAYLDIDGCILCMGYSTLISNECLVPIDHIKIIEIDRNTDKIRPFKGEIKPKEITTTDQYLNALFQAQDYMKTFPQYGKKVGNPYFCAITFYDKFGTAAYTERVNNILYRKLSQKIIPTQLIEASDLVIPKNIDDPLMILNKNGEIIAKIYWACSNNIYGEEPISQLLQDKTIRPIEYGKLLPKDLRTHDIIAHIQEGRKR